VISEIGSSEKREILAMGETPNIAARLQGLAEPDTLVISATTEHLVQGLFEHQDLGPQTLKGISAPLSVYRVIGESAAQSRFAAAVSKGLTPLVGREEELGLLQRRWEQAKAGEGQVVLLSGEPGIGKSRLVEALKGHVRQGGATPIEFRCSPYHQNSAFYPIIDHLQRLLRFEREDSPEEKLKKLENARVGATGRSPLQPDTIPLLAALLSLPHPEGYPPITLSPQKQKQKTQEALVTWLVEEAERTAIYCAWEDLHWADPSTLEVLQLLIDQAPTTRLFMVLTFRPEFTPPWRLRAHITQLTLNRLGRQQVETMVEQVTKGNSLPADILQQIVSKTDGVPLFVEELTKSIMEAVVDVGARHAVPLSLAIPATLQDSLMARLDRLGPAKAIAQLGATLGREFSHGLLQAVSLLDDEKLQSGLRQLVDAELMYQRGLPPQANYIFKHALIQDTAYQSLLKSTRLQYHQQIAHVLEERFPETKETQPELLAHHYTEAGLIVQAIPYWQQAGRKASQRSANVEAIAHLTKGLDLLKTLPDAPERAQQEISLQITLGTPLIVAKGYTAPEVEKAYTRALELCRYVGEIPQLFPVLRGLVLFYQVRGDLQTARELGEQGMRLAQNVQNPIFLSEAYHTLGINLFWLGKFASARAHLEQSITLYDSQQHSSRSSLSLQEPKMHCLSYTAWALWFLGYPNQALERMSEALALAQELPHSYSQAWALIPSAELHQHRREKQLTRERAEAAIALATDLGFPSVLAMGPIMRGWALAEQGQGEEGIGQIRQGITAWQTMGELQGPYSLALLAEAYGKVGQIEEGLSVLAKALALVNKNGERWWEAELYRLKGELTLQSSVQRLESSVTNPQSPTPNTQHLTPSTQAEAEAEACFLKAIDIAQRQQAKSLELRAAMSLARLWQQQGKQQAACNILSEIYNWFTEGFDTKDLQEAKALIEELSH
jgi:predicted ATPase